MKELIKKIIPTLNFPFPYSPEEYAENLFIENYHKHTYETNCVQIDCAESIDAYATQTLSYGGKCLFSGEHGWQGNVYYTYKKCEESNLKFRYSTEAYWVKDRFEKDRTNNHILLIAKNDEGRKDLNYALSLANEEGYYYKARLDLDLLFKIPKDNVYVTSACIAGWKYDDAEDIWLKMHDYFGDNFFLEIQCHNTEPQKKLNKRILKLAKDNDIQIICGLDSHYVKEENRVKRDQILKYKGIKYEDEEGWYLDYPSGKEIFNRLKEQGILTDEEILTSMMNTNIFINNCEEIIFDKNFKIPCVYPETTYDERVKIFKKILNERYKKEKLKSKEKIKGIQYEASQIIESGVVDYFLTNDKIIHNAVTEEGGILTTTSRGSSASYIINKLLGFTTIDRFNSEIPIYPERFLTKDRVLSGQMPDIDMNVAKQEPFVKATRKLIGEHGCYPLMAIEKLKEKASWQLYAGANDIPPDIANQISKFIDEYNEKLKYAEEEDKEFIHVEDFIPNEYIDIYEKSLEYQGITINAKAHACGHLILDKDIRREIGLIRTVSETTGKSVLCCAIEGIYLDEFGYVKNDFLIVDSVHLTYELFKSIGQTVPTFEELREMINEDDLTWNIYSRGITCCVNQCEKASTTKKVMQYKPKNLAELSAFIAGIRPGFKSLLPTFISRVPYSTSEKAIDDVLKDSYSFMLYQESLMKILSFLGIPMSESYGVIKSISKKKLKGAKLEKLENDLKKHWNDKIGNLDNFDKIWQVFKDSTRYAFNSPHALSMGGDSAYEAWFKAHHTTKFYEIAINHYQEKNKKDKIDALVKEALIYFDFKLGEYEFGKDNRKVNIDENNKIIYPNLSSLKGFGENVSQILYEMGQRKYNNFVDFLDEVKGINRPILIKLIKLNYFKCFGEINVLLDIIKYYDLLSNAKEISKAKLLENGIDIDFAKKYGNETAKKINKLDSNSLLKDIISKIEPRESTVKEILNSQKEILGIITYKNNEYSNQIFYISELEVLKSITKAKVYCINNGKTHGIKMWTTQYNKNPFSLGDFIYISKLDKKNKKRPTNEINPKTGKKIYEDIEGKFEAWLNTYTIMDSNNF